MSKETKHSDYDDEPVVYCARCYSLKIKYEEAIDADCCMECGCSDVKSASIDEWEQLYAKRYGTKYVVKRNDIRKSPLFNMPISSLKMMVYENPSWKNIIRSMYPRFPEGLSKSDSIILLFDKATKDNRMDDLKTILFKYSK